MRKFFRFAIPVLIFLSLVLTACGETPSTESGTVRVMVSADAGATVLSQNPVEVAVGSSVEFDIKIADTYAFVSVSEGTYNQKTGKLKIDNVTEKMTVKFVTLELGYDTTLTTPYSFIAGADDTTSHIPTPKLNYGTEITVNANDKKRVFIGWSFGASYEGGGKIVSTDREYVFRASPDLGAQ